MSEIFVELAGFQLYGAGFEFNGYHVASRLTQPDFGLGPLGAGSKGCNFRLSTRTVDFKARESIRRHRGVSLRKPVARMSCNFYCLSGLGGKELGNQPEVMSL